MENAKLTTQETVAEVITAPMWHHLRGLMFTRTGYGSKIPTPKMAIWNNKRYRIYCSIFSNSGICYIISKGKRHIVDYVDNNLISIGKSF